MRAARAPLPAAVFLPAVRTSFVIRTAIGAPALRAARAPLPAVFPAVRTSLGNRTLIAVPALRAAPVVVGPLPPGVRSTSFGSSTLGCRGLVELRDGLFELLEHLAVPLLHQVADLAIAAEACGPQRGDLALQRGDPLQVPLELLLEQIEALADLADAADLSSR